MRFKPLIVAMFAVLLPVAAVAEPPQYTYVEGGWIDIDAGGGSGSADGWFAGGSFEVKAVEIIGEYADLDAASMMRVGVGWHGLLGDQADIVASAAWVDVDVDTGSDADGYRLSGGARWRITERLEINGFANYLDLDAGSDTSLEGNVLFHFGTLALGLGYENNDIDTTRAYVRWNFR